MVRKELMFFLQRKIYADPCSNLVRSQAQFCGPAVHDPQEAGGSLIFRLGFAGRGFSSILTALLSKVFRSPGFTARMELMSTVE